MANSSPIRYGKDFVQGTNATFSDLFLPVYGGEVLAAFEEMSVAKDIVRTMSMPSGVSMEFPMIHKMSAERHAAGTELLGTDIQTSKRSITLDERPLVAHFDLDDVDEAMAHYETRSEIAKQAGRAIAREMDKNVLQLCVRASRTPAVANTDFDGGGYKADPSAALDGTAYELASGTGANNLPASATGAWNKDNALALLGAIEDIVVAWDQRDVPQEERFCVVPTDCWHRLRTIGVPESTSAAAGLIGYYPFQDGTMPQRGPAEADSSRAGFLTHLGVNIVRSNFLPNGTNTQGIGETNYQDDYTKTRAICIQKQAVGLLTLMGVQTETDRDVRRQTDFFVTKMLYGGGTLRPECAVEIAIP